MDETDSRLPEEGSLDYTTLQWVAKGGWGGGKDTIEDYYITTHWLLQQISSQHLKATNGTFFWESPFLFSNQLIA